MKADAIQPVIGVTAVDGTLIQGFGNGKVSLKSLMGLLENSNTLTLEFLDEIAVIFADYRLEDCLFTAGEPVVDASGKGIYDKRSPLEKKRRKPIIYQRPAMVKQLAGILSELDLNAFRKRFHFAKLINALYDTPLDRELRALEPQYYAYIWEEIQSLQALYRRAAADGLCVVLLPTFATDEDE